MLRTEPRLAIQSLGTLVFSLDGQILSSFRSAKTQALFLYMSVERERPRRRERLAAMLWPESDTKEAKASFRQ